MVEDIIGNSVISGVRGLDLEPFRGLGKALGFTHRLGTHRVHAICMGMHIYTPFLPP